MTCEDMVMRKANCELPSSGYATDFQSCGLPQCNERKTQKRKMIARKWLRSVAAIAEKQQLCDSVPYAKSSSVSMQWNCSRQRRFAAGHGRLT